MPRRRTLTLTEQQKQELERMRDRSEKGYLRERAAALLKIAAGGVASQVAEKGLYKPRDPDTVYSWLKGYEREGIAGLAIKKGRGRKPLFSPSA
ncbi:MAG: helix-turn-helix domain-containing protein [Caldilineaceae bacterium]|nr:helix-turn-helix domain-containing protein [Caldilineaceae bacterium]